MGTTSPANLMKALRQDRSLALAFAWLFLLAGLLWGFAHKADAVERQPDGRLAFVLCIPGAGSADSDTNSGSTEPCSACLIGHATMPACPSMTTARQAEFESLQTLERGNSVLAGILREHCPARGPPGGVLFQQLA